ncbi:MAG: amidohydrolase family protein [Candidatus Thermoplasmatota archaeon]
MKYVEGELITPSGFEPGYIGFDDNRILENGRGNAPGRGIANGLILPGFFNAHTHIGDSFIRKKNVTLPRSIEELVAPPNGLKHRLLREATDREIIDGMVESIAYMKQKGTVFFCDFRENGIRGVMQLKTALKHEYLDVGILSRPREMKYHKEELKMLLDNSDGIGVSSISDWEYTDLMKIAKEVKRKGKIFSLHASERIREDIDGVIDLKPDMLVHMNQANLSDLIRVKEADIPVVICPRSNAFFGLKRNYMILKESGVRILLGTDNAMLHEPDILEEVRYIMNDPGNVFTLHELLMMITYNPRKVLNEDGGILVQDSESSFVVLERGTLKPLYVHI